MSKKEKKNKPKKNRWIMKFVVFALILLVICVAVGRSIPALPNILGVIYILAGLAWFIMHTRVSAE